MSLQLYYLQNIQIGASILPATLGHHLVNVLRMQASQNIMLTNGKGVYAEAIITEANKKNCVVEVQEICTATKNIADVNIAIAFTKNTARMEWLLEKITEIGIANIYPIITARTEKLFFKKERFQKIIESAMCQSLQYYLPTLHEPITFKNYIENNNCTQNIITHCMLDVPKVPLQNIPLQNTNTTILIGPEGDFTEEEIQLCLQKKYESASLGNTRLRTETAGLVGVTLLNSILNK